MSSTVIEAAAGLRGALAGVEPGLLSGADCARLAEALAVTEKACAGLRLLVSARAVECRAHEERGFRDGAAWLARTTGATFHQARRELETAAKLDACPDTTAALRSGQVSLAQAGEIARAEADTPGAEAALLADLGTSDLAKLRDRTREYRETHTQVDDLHQQQRQARQFRHWRDSLGMVCGGFTLPPEIGLPLVRRVEADAQRARRAARHAGPPEPFEAYAADAFAALAGGGAERPRHTNRTQLVIVCDLNAWRRGHAHPGEVCHIIEGGPIPVSVAKQLGKDAFLKAVLHDGVNIHTVKHFGRHRTAELQTALDLGPVPEFTGAQCADCGQRWGLQWDHVNPFANHGPTTYANLQPRCWADHQDKTDRDSKAGLLGAKPP